MKKILSALVALIVAALVLSGCAQPLNPDFDASQIACGEAITAEVTKVTEEVKAAEEVVKLTKAGTPAEKQAKANLEAAQAKKAALEERAKACADSLSKPAKEGGTTEVDTGDGVAEVPWAQEEVNDGDTRDSAAMPSIHTLLPNCSVLESWGQLVDCVDKNDAQFFRDGVNAHKKPLGFNWADVQAWAKARTPDGHNPEARVIFLSGEKTKLTDEAANEAVKSLTGGKTLKVVRLDRPAFMNMWRFRGKSQQMQAFADYGDQVRVSLTPLVLNEQGQAVGLNETLRYNGVFVDCYNPHGLWQEVPARPGNLPPETTTPVAPPPTKPEPTTPPPTKPVAKDASKARPGNPSSKEGVNPKAGEAKAPKGPTVKDPSGKTTTVKPADPTKPPKAPAPEAPAPGATPVPTTAPPPPPRETAAPAPSAPPATPIERGDPAP